MRVLVVASRPSWTADTHFMAHLAAGLSARGLVVAIATALRSDTEREVERRWPKLSVRGVSGRAWWRQAMSLRGIVTALRPNVLLVGTEADAVLAAVASATGRPIVRRITTAERVVGDAARGERTAALPWLARRALAGARITEWGRERLIIGWPTPAPGVASGAHGAGVHRLPAPTSAVVLVPGHPHDEDTAQALRVLAHVRSRHADLRVLLTGTPSALQATRLHAAALDLGRAVQIVPIDALLQHELAHAGAAWIAASGEAGAVAALAAMQQRVPVLVAHDAPFAELVTPGVTGWHIPADAEASVAADLARVLGDAAARRTMGTAAAARIAREYSWDTLVDDAAEVLARRAGPVAARAAPGAHPGLSRILP